VQLKPEELRNEVLLSKDKYKETAWHKAAKLGRGETLEKLWDWDKELQLKPEKRLLSKTWFGKSAWHLAAK
jgi:hypothetical protein